jgi:hypothetical protein
MKVQSKILSCSAAILAVLTLSARTEAQVTYDHLKCFKAKDTKTFKKATADITVGPGHLAGLQNCTISAGAKEFCIPVRKTSVVVEEGSDNPFAGENQRQSRLCYKLKCPASDPGSQTYMDQFGARLIDGFKVASLCTPTVIGDLPVDAPPTWPATPQAYTSEKASYIDTLTIPPISGGHPTCCRDFGAISRDAIEVHSSFMDNALATLADGLGTFGIDIQATLTDSLQDGSLVLLLDHRDLEATLPDEFALAQFIGSFAPGTDYTIASAGNGTFYADPALSFLPGSGEPRNFAYPALMTSPAMTAGPLALSLSLPFGFLTLNVSAEQSEVNGDATISPGGVAYTNGELSGFILTDDIFNGLNLVLNSPLCACLGLSSDVYSKAPSGLWGSDCISNASTLCNDPGEEVCVTLAGTNLFGSPPQVCTVLPGALQENADIDLDSDPSVYEGMSVGLQFTAKNATFTVP